MGSVAAAKAVTMTSSCTAGSAGSWETVVLRGCVPAGAAVNIYSGNSVLYAVVMLDKESQRIDLKYTHSSKRSNAIQKRQISCSD